MKYGSVCSGIEAASVAWEPLGWKPAWFAEIEKFPSQVLTHHYPEVPNHGDFTLIRNAEHPADKDIDLLVGGTPCQSFSLAGLRNGLDDDRGQLALEFMRLAGAIRPRWIVWENVPGALSSGGGRDFGSILGALAELGYGFAYRVLDAHHFGVPQRRRRIFLVGHSGGSCAGPAAVLFEPKGMYRNSAPGEAKPSASCDSVFSFYGYAGYQDFEQLNVAVPPKACGTKSPVAIASNALAPRKLTPLECERLMGFPDGWTDIRPKGKPTPDGPRYKALGNSMAVNVMSWIGARIDLVDGLIQP